MRPVWEQGLASPAWARVQACPVQGRVSACRALGPARVCPGWVQALGCLVTPAKALAQEKVRGTALAKARGMPGLATDSPARAQAPESLALLQRAGCHRRHHKR